ncbi:CheR family methyltransferase [Zavarzinia sp. CC-PAN008]|uniref:CheR family methyltransferase n=1 Tax=Zavarzinia sp. CC-PAN008 TaxID=3243332 RepID=UPI003F74587C
MKPEDFDLLAGIIRQRSGLVLTRDKLYLLESRLIPVARKRGLAGLEQLVQALRARRDESLLKDITEAMTTNESFFFRDKTPFELFEKVILPELMTSRAGTKTIRIWFAAASTGQEPYSVAMILKEKAELLRGWRIELVGTDLSTDVLDRARAGLYTQFEVQRGLPIQMLVKYFTQVGDQWQIDPALKAMVKYREYNLLHDLTALGRFDVVFCRNVLIYFDAQTKGEVLARISKVMPDDGFLFLGAAETVLGITTAYRPAKDARGLYVPATSPRH